LKFRDEEQTFAKVEGPKVDFFLYIMISDIIFYITILFLNFVKYKNLLVSVGFITIFNYFLYFLVAKI